MLRKSGKVGLSGFLGSRSPSSLELLRKLADSSRHGDAFGVIIILVSDRLQGYESGLPVGLVQLTALLNFFSIECNTTTPRFQHSNSVYRIEVRDADIVCKDELKRRHHVSSFNRMVGMRSARFCLAHPKPETGERN